MNRSLLEKPFAPAQIRQRKGRNGVLDYVEGHSVIQRLNEALEGAWSFEVIHHEVREDEVLVLGKLSLGAEGVTKMSFGASQVTREKTTGKPLSLGDDLKAAGTDCLKKCATFLGVGLHLYAEKPLGGRPAAMRADGPPRPPVPPGPPPARSVTSPPPPRPSPNGNGAAPIDGDVGRPMGNGDVARPMANGDVTRLMATPRQLDAIAKVGLAKGLEAPAVESMSLRVFNRKPEALTREEASGLLRELTNLKRSGT
jgi:hypothetical protein